MKLQRSINMVGLLFISVGSMIGSGWLFGPLYAAQIAGPASVLAWALGGALVMVVALTFAELSAMLPVAGGLARFPQFSHGAMVSFIMTWLAWVAYVLLPPIEVQAMLQYSATYFPWLIHSVDGGKALSGAGIAAAALLLFIMSFLNILGVKLVAKFNTLLVCLKILVPAVTALTLIWINFQPANFTDFGGFAPYGIKGVLSSLPLAGVIFSFFGFRLSIEMAEEAKNPQKALPFALLGSLLICMVLYTLVQFSFVGAEAPARLANGWAHLTFLGDDGPFVGIALGLGLLWLVGLLYLDAFFSPFGSALMVVTTTARLDYAMGVNGYVPKILTKLNNKGVPAVAIALNYIVGLILLLPFPGWQKLASFIIAALVISHAVAPICLVALREQIPERHRPFRLPAHKLISLVAFIILNLVSYWTGWETIWKMYLAAAFGLVVLVAVRALQPKTERPLLHAEHAWWLLPYFIGMALFSYYGNFGAGLKVLPFGWDMLGLAVFSTLIFYLGIKQRLPAELAATQIAHEESLLPPVDTVQV